MALAFLLLALQPAAAPPDAEALKKEIAGLKGTWKISKLEAAGQPSLGNVMDQLRFVITDDTLTLTDGKANAETTKYKLSLKETPKQIDIIAVRPQADGAKKEQAAPGIYELAGDTLRICFVKEGARPTAFASKAGDPAVLMELKREKK